MSVVITAQPLTQETFAPFGEVIALRDTADKMINAGNCARHHDLAAMDFADGRAGISLFHAKPYPLPLRLDMMERHPQGSQAFIPMYKTRFLVIVAQYSAQNPAYIEPADIKVFLSDNYQGVNYRRNIWHGVLCPLVGEGIFAVVDRIGAGQNLVEHFFVVPPTVIVAQ